MFFRRFFLVLAMGVFALYGVTLGMEHRFLVRFPSADTEMELSAPAITESQERIEWVYPEVQVPGGGAFVLKRILFKDNRTTSGHESRESLILTPLATINTEVIITRQLKIQKSVVGEMTMTLPLRNGWGKSVELLDDHPVLAQYWLGTRLSASDPEIALPVTEVVFPDSSRLAVMSDPYLGTLFSAQKEADGVLLQQRFLYDGQKVPLQDEQVRTFGLWIQQEASFEDSVDAFFRLMLEDVPPGPAWIHEIAMVHFDFLSDGGDGWTHDLIRLAELLTPEERGRVLCCYHGRYADNCTYLLDPETGKIRSEWNAMALTRNVPFTIERVKKELRLAKSLGFRTCFYFADGLLQDSGHPAYRPDWNFVNLTKGVHPPGSYGFLNTEGNVNGWTGPDTWGLTYVRDPGNPEVAKWYSDYLDALLETFGEDLDAFVWDETYYIFQGYIGTSPKPVYSDIAMMKLVKRLTKQVTDFDPEKAFFVCDVINMHPFFYHIPANAMVAHGTYQDSQCKPEAWSYAMFPNWRNVFWSCNWWPVTRFANTKFGVEHFGTPVAISNGWEDDIGPSEWTPEQQELFLRLFRERCKQQSRPRYLKVDPAVILQNKP